MKLLTLRIKKQNGFYVTDPDVGLNAENPSDLLGSIYMTMSHALLSNTEARDALEDGKIITLELTLDGWASARVSVTKVPWTCKCCKSILHNPNLDKCFYCNAPYSD